MDTREVAAEYRLSHWAGIIKERRESGLSVRAYCKTTGRHENTYFYWQKKLREAACNGMLSAEAAKKTPAIPAGWAVCETADAEQKGDFLYIEIGKSKIKVTAGTGQELLSKVCRTLAELC